MKLMCILLCLILMFSGCSNSISTELSNRLIIEAIGIDADENGYKISVLALNTVQASSPSSADSPDGIAKVFTVTADSIAAAFSEIDSIGTQIPLYSQTRVLILGKDIAENQPLTALNFFIREYTTRNDIPVAMAKTSAEKIISADMGKSTLVSKIIDDLLHSGSRNGLTVRVPLYKFISHLSDKTDAAWLPVLEVRKNAQKKNEIHTNGIALFANDNYTKTLTDLPMEGFLYANKFIDSTLLQVNFENNNISLAVRNVRTKIKSSNTNPANFKINLTFSCDIVEQNSVQHALTEEDLCQIKLLAEEKIRQSIADFLKFTLQELGCDCLSFGNRIRRKNPAYYDKIIENNTSFPQNLQCDISVKGSIHRPGREILTIK